MHKLTHKGYGRIYVETPADIKKVEAVIQELDAFEFEYLPEKLVACFTEYPQVVYTHKFSDMDMDKLTVVCWRRGIKIWVFDAGTDEFPRDAGV